MDMLSDNRLYVHFFESLCSAIACSFLHTSQSYYVYFATAAVPVGHTSTVWDVAFSPQGDYLASCSDDTSIKIWKVDNRNGDSCSCSMISTLAGYHARTIFSIHWSANEYIATGSADNSIHVFKATLPGNASEIDSSTQGVSMECRVELDGDVNCVRWNPMQPTILASAGDDGSIKIWELCAV